MFNGEPNLPQEQMLLHLGLVEPSDDDPFHWESKWIGHVLCSNGMTVRTLMRLKGDYDDDDDAIPFLPWGTDEVIGR